MLHCTAGVGPRTNSIPALYRRSAAADQMSSASSTRFHGRYQIYGFCQPSVIDSLCERVSTCVDDVSSWMRANRLSLNPATNEVLWCSSPWRQHLIPIGAVHINSTSVFSVRSMYDQGICIDADTEMKSHVTATVKACFTALQQIRSVWRSLPRHALLTLIRTLIVSKVNLYFWTGCSLSWTPLLGWFSRWRSHSP